MAGGKTKKEKGVLFSSCPTTRPKKGIQSTRRKEKGSKLTLAKESASEAGEKREKKSPCRQSLTRKEKKRINAGKKSGLFY